MGCKFSIQVDQARPKTPLWTSKTRERKESSETQTDNVVERKESSETQTDNVVASPDAEEKETKDGYESSPEQVTLKTIASTHRLKQKWKP